MSAIERLRYMRKKEFEMVFRDIAIYPHLRILEIGCGDGFQSSLLRKYSNYVVSTDLTTERTLNLDIICDAEYLPFKNGSFDIIYSSNVLEHIRDRDKGLSEMKHVLSDDGFIIIMVPTSVWKVLSLLVYYPVMGGYVIKLVKKKLMNKNDSKISGKSKIDISTRGPWDYLKFLLPGVHGEYQSNVEEFNAFRISSWKRLLRANGLEIIKTKKTLLYSPPEFPIVPAVDLSKLGICSTVAFISKAQRADKCATSAAFMNHKKGC